MLVLATLLFGVLAAAHASSAVMGSPLRYSTAPESYTIIFDPPEPTIATEPTFYTISSYSSGYSHLTIVETSNSQVHTLTLSSCPPPPTDLDVCLTSIFSTMITQLTSIISVLHAHEASIQVLMHHEHTLLYSEISWVYVVNSIASSVVSAVEVNYQAIDIQIYQLQLELEQINYAYEVLEVQLNYLEAEAHNVQVQQNVIYVKYQSVRVAKWSLYSAISAIVYEKLVIEKEFDMIEIVMATLTSEMGHIEYKISELNNRQEWLMSWELKLVAKLSAFEYEVEVFRNLEVDIVAVEASLYIQQYRLLQKVAYLEVAVEQLHVEYANIELQLEQLQVYFAQLSIVMYSVSHEAASFVLAYSEFTCEDSLLYYLACSKTLATSVIVPYDAHPVTTPRDSHATGLATTRRAD